MHTIWLVLLVLSVSAVGAAPAPSITCPANITIANATDCGMLAFVLPPVNANGTNVTQSISGLMTFAIGETAIVYTATYGLQVANCTSYVIVQPNTIANYSACAYDGVCGDTIPFDCVCPAETGGDHCCIEINGLICSGHGECGPTGICECDTGYGGRWCCPEVVTFTNVSGVTTTTYATCNGQGCCTFNGTCACDDGFSGDNCNVTSVVPQGTAFRGAITDNVVIIVGSVVGAVAAVLAVGVIVGVGSAAGGAGAAAAATASVAVANSSSAVALTPIVSERALLRGNDVPRSTPVGRIRGDYEY
jgi:hypothetical protein